MPFSNNDLKKLKKLIADGQREEANRFSQGMIDKLKSKRNMDNDLERRATRSDIQFLDAILKQKV